MDSGRFLFCFVLFLYCWTTSDLYYLLNKLHYSVLKLKMLQVQVSNWVY